MRVIVKQIKTVAVRTPLKAMPVPGVDRIEGFTTTMYDIVKKVVMPAIASVRMLGFAISRVLIGRVAIQIAQSAGSLCQQKGVRKIYKGGDKLVEGSKDLLSDHSSTHKHNSPEPDGFGPLRQPAASSPTFCVLMSDLV